MQVVDPPKISFMAAFKRHEPVIMDSTAMMTYKTCPRKYFYRIVLGFSPKETAEYFAFGTAYHKFREVLQRKADVDKLPVQEAFIEALKVAEAFYPEAKQPKLGSKWDFLTKDRLRQSCYKAFEHWLKERLDGHIRVIAFEQPFILELADGTKIAGRADNIVDWRHEIWGRDFKTSSKLGPFYSRTLEPNDQFTRYTFGEAAVTGRKVKGQIVEVLFNSKKEGPKIEVFTTTRSEGQIARWLQEHSFWISLIEKSRNEDMYPMNEKSCSFCEYHSVCKAASESGQMSQLKAYYKVEPWDCTKSPDEGTNS